MIKDLNIIFKDIKYKDSNHTYVSNGKPLMSVTKFLESLKKPFDENYWCVYKAYEYSGYTVKMIWGNNTTFLANGEKAFIHNNHDHLKVTPDNVLKQWDIENLIGTTRGSYVHQYLERKEKRFLDEISLPTINLTTLDTIYFYSSLAKMSNLCDLYLEENTHLTPICIEYMVGDEKLGLAGTLDRLYYNHITQEYEIWDFKTDKKFKTSNKYQKLNLFNVEECEYNKYSLQLSLYRYIIEKNLNIKLGQSNVVYFNLKENQYSIFPAIDFTSLIKDNVENITTHIKYSISN